MTSDTTRLRGGRRLLSCALATAGLTSCLYDEAAYSRPRLTSASLTLEPRMAPADGTGSVTLVVRDAVSSNRAVSATVTLTGAGWLAVETQSRTIDLDVSGNGRAIIRAQLAAGTAFLTASIGGVTLTDSITYSRAEPDTIDVAPAAAIVSARSPTAASVVATVRRFRGTPAIGWRISLRAVDSTASRDLGIVSVPAPTGSDGSVTATIAIRDTLYTGPMLLLAQLKLDSGKLVTGRAAVLVRP